MEDTQRQDHQPRHNIEDSSHPSVLKIPAAMSIKEVVIIITAVITVVSAWGVYGTRLALVEDKTTQHEKKIDQVLNSLADLQKQVNVGDNERVELRQRLNYLERIANK